MAAVIFYSLSRNLAYAQSKGCPELARREEKGSVIMFLYKLNLLMDTYFIYVNCYQN